jgi:plasmid stabilization system protein ParE
VGIVFTHSARDQFLVAIEDLRRKGPRAAAAFRQQSDQALKRLLQAPESGDTLPEFPDLPYREIRVSSHRFVYRVHEGDVWIVAVRPRGERITQAPEEP